MHADLHQAKLPKPTPNLTPGKALARQFTKALQGLSWATWLVKTDLLKDSAKAGTGGQPAEKAADGSSSGTKSLEEEQPSPSKQQKLGDAEEEKVVSQTQTSADEEGEAEDTKMLPEPPTVEANAATVPASAATTAGGEAGEAGGVQQPQ